jgi:hypothetical protein
MADKAKNRHRKKSFENNDTTISTISDHSATTTKGARDDFCISPDPGSASNDQTKQIAARLLEHRGVKSKA